MRVLLVDDHSLFREGVATLLRRQPDFTVVGEAGSVAEAIVMVNDLKPDLILMDFGLPDGTGLEATEAILANRSEVKIVFLTVHEDDERLFAAIRRGAKGYLLKNVRSTELLERLRGVCRGEAAVSPATAGRILEEFSRLADPMKTSQSQSSGLTARETDVLREMVGGATNAEIAESLVISENTVKNHVRSILSKLQLPNRREAARYAQRHFDFVPIRPPRPTLRPRR